MNLKEQIIQELEQIPESQLSELLEVVRIFKDKYQDTADCSEVWKAYLASKREREEVYRRLADS
ncbi:hypothetical protein Riv7116_6846 [Rivularia sp. PCC 7116]|uniref:hypothetical protein n=1 Tax=Rivularia sp. PCC 7116 TaxID=373994 RepID=UPI00029ECE98|nr:hypothetical protein [Rivularia sp. PCC 7116]AFY59161.1 hypothetical protein Riv7116_6846 [Rivularia sp. PCC 7116]